MTPQPPRTVDLFVNGRWQPPQGGQYEPAEKTERQHAFIVVVILTIQ